MKKLKYILPILLISLVVYAADRFGNIGIIGNTISSVNTDGNIILDPNGSGQVRFNDLTAETVPYLDSNKDLVSSDVTPTELGYLDGVTTSIQAQINTVDILVDGLIATLGDVTEAEGNQLENIGSTTIDPTQWGYLGAFNQDLTTTSTVSFDSGTFESGINLADEAFLRLYDSGTNNYFGLKAPSTLTTSTQFTLPDGDGDSGQAIITDGSGTLSWGDAGGGSGFGTFNLWDNPTFDSNVDGVNEYSDTGSADPAFPVDGTGGTASVINVSQETGSPLRGDGSFLITKSGNTSCQGEGASIDITAELDDHFKTREIKFQYLASADYATDDFKVFFCDTSNCDVVNGDSIDVTGSDTETSIRAVGSTTRTRTFRGRVQFTDATTYRLMWHCSSTSTSDYTLRVDQLSIGEVETYPGYFATKPESYTPDFTGFGTVTNVNIKWWREGRFLYISGNFQAGSTTATEARLSFPNSYVSDSDLPTLSLAGNVIKDPGAGSTSYDWVALKEPNVSYFTFGLQQSSVTALNKGNGSSLFSSGDTVSINASVPIEGWDVGAQLSPSEVEPDIVEAEGNGGTGITADTTDIDFTEVTDPSGFWSGTVFKPNRPMRVEFKGSVLFSSGTSGSVVYYIDGSAGKGIGTNASQQAHPFNGEVDLEANQELSIRFSSNGTLSNSSTFHWIKITEKPTYKTFQVHDTPSVVGWGYFAGTTNCEPTVTSSTFAALSDDTDCPGPTVSGNPGPGTIQTTDADNIKFTVTSLPAGTYEVLFNHQCSQSSASNAYAFAVNDGTTTSIANPVTAGDVDFPCNTVGYFTYTSSGDRTFSLFGSSNTGSVTVKNSNSPWRETSFSIKRYSLR